LALLAALFFARRKGAAKKNAEVDLSSTLTPPTTASLTANSVFRTTGGQSVDTASQVPAPTDFKSRNDKTPTPVDWLPQAKALHNSYYALHEWLGIAWLETARLLRPAS
jgi:hypothetical protein